MLILLLIIEVSIRTRTWVFDELDTIKISDFFKNNIAAYIGFLFSVFPIFLVELFLPNDTTKKDYLHGLFFWIISIQCNYFFSLMAIGAITYFDISPLFNISFESLSVNSFFDPLMVNLLLVILSLFVFDFFYYWFHRMQHTVSFFWQFHKTHHSIENLNAIASYHHLSEELFRIPFVTIPLALLIKIDAPHLAILSSFFAVYGQFIHMNSKLSLGFFRFFLADNYYHRIHHSLEKHHFDKNFAAFFPFWDVFFRTAHFPKNNEFPKVGLSYESQPRNLKEYLFRAKPFKKKHIE